MCKRVVDWFRDRPIKKGIFTAIMIVVVVFILIMTIMWMKSLDSQFRGLIIKASESASEGYTPEFEKNLTAFIFTVKDYGTIALTFFGITLLGGIFDLRRARTTEDSQSRITVIMIFCISIVFLLCFMTLHLLYTYIYPYIIIDSNGILTLLGLGLNLFIIAINLLLYILIFHLFILISNPRGQPNAPKP
jgi:hypothetical protein